MQTPKTVRVFTRLLDHGHECARLWTYLRALDVQGSGVVVINYGDIAEAMNVSVRTVQRWISQGLDKGWFRNVLRHQKTTSDSREIVTYIYLAGIKPVRTILGVDGLGAIADVDPSYLGRSEAKALCTALEAQYRQKQAYYAAKKAAKGRRKQLVLDPEKMATSETMLGVKSHVVVSGPFSIPGCSHAGLAKATDWSPSTIKRRFDNRWRCDRNLDPIQKVRVGVELDDPELLFQMRQEGHSFLVAENAVGLPRVLKVLNVSGRSKLVQLGCNIYHTSYELLSCRSLRGRVKSKKKERDRTQH